MICFHMKVQTAISYFSMISDLQQIRDFLKETSNIFDNGNGVTYFSCTNVFTLGSPGLWVSKQVGCFNLLADLWFWSGTDRLPRHPVVPDDPGGGNAVLPSPGDPDGCSTVHSSHWHLVGRMHHCRAPGSTRSLPSQQPSTAGILSTFLAPLYPLPRPHLIAVFQMFCSIFFCTFLQKKTLGWPVM